MVSNDRKLSAVIGATGKQGGAVLRQRQSKVRALTRNPGKHRELAEEVVEADLHAHGKSIVYLRKERPLQRYEHSRL
jgi:putative NADH-flavin reductase